MILFLNVSCKHSFFSFNYFLDNDWEDETIDHFFDCQMEAK